MPMVPLAPAMAVKPFLAPPRVVSVSRTNCTGPGSNPSVAPSPKAPATSPTFTGVQGYEALTALCGGDVYADKRHPLIGTRLAAAPQLERNAG